jgi:anti-sigma-K factor RskA
MSRPDQDALLDLAPAYALGALSAEEAQRFEAYLATSPEARREVAEYREIGALLALSQAEARPAAELRDRVLARVGKQKTPTLPPLPAAPWGRQPTPAAWGALAASLLVIVGLGAGMISLRGRVDALRTELAAREQTLSERERLLRAREATLNAILEPGVKLFQLTASGDPEPGIQLFWDQRRNVAILHGFRLKGVPEGRAYQLWFVKDGKPIPSITFKPESDGHAKVERIPVPTGGVLSAAAVTVEPESGSPQPTSPILLVGPLQQKS